MAADIAFDFDERLADDDRRVAEGAKLLALASELLDGEALDEPVEVAVLLGGPELLHELNREHRGIDEPTDVLSFPASEGAEFPAIPGEPRYLGDIAISVPTVRENAMAAGMTAELELRHVLLHGLLHLLGYDHEMPDDDALMRGREESILGPEVHAGRGDGGHTDHE
ncbi:MAG: rRNA maturation RNase YbeY [Dehalococcoidia bacterium]